MFFCPAESSDIPLETMEKLITNAGGLYITHREDFAVVRFLVEKFRMGEAANRVGNPGRAESAAISLLQTL